MVRVAGSNVSSCWRGKQTPWTRGQTYPPMPTIPTLLPGPQPFLNTGHERVASEASGMESNADIPNKGREDGETTAEHGGGVLEGDVVGDLEAELLVTHNDAGVPAVGDLAVRVLAVVLGLSMYRQLRQPNAVHASSEQASQTYSVNGGALAVVLVVVLAAVTLHARVDLGTEASAVAGLELLHLGADAVDDAGNFVAGDPVQQRELLALVVLLV